MKKQLLYLFSLICLLTSCSQEIDDVVKKDGYTYELQMMCDVPGYDGEATRATRTWKSGAKVFLNFQMSGYIVYGTAVYDGNKWTLSTGEKLSGSGQCTGMNVEDYVSENGITVVLNAHSSLYKSSSGSWSAKSNTVQLKMTLKPFFGRFRLKGTAGRTVKVEGLRTFTEYNIYSGMFISTLEPLIVTLGSDGYSPYIYSTIDKGHRTLTVDGYSMTCPDAMFAQGTSGVVVCPTSTSHAGWTGEGTEEVQAYVDLGLPSGTLWATRNVGASKPEEYGDYFAWGETKPQDERIYFWDSYSLCQGSSASMTRYCTQTWHGTVDGITELLAEDDPATANWGDEWCTPSQNQADELCNSAYTKWEWVEQNEVSGRLVTSKINANSIFFPASGTCSYEIVNGGETTGYYWTRSLGAQSYQAYRLRFSYANGVFQTEADYRFFGMTVRPVRR